MYIHIAITGIIEHKKYFFIFFEIWKRQKKKQMKQQLIIATPVFLVYARVKKKTESMRGYNGCGKKRIARII